MKKIIRIGLMASLVMASTAAFAQSSQKTEYPRYGFWSNWSIGASIDLNHQHKMGGISFGDDWRASTNIGMDLYLQHKLNHAFDLRIRYGYPTFGRPLHADVDGKSYEMDRHSTLTLDLMWSINNAFAGYDPDRRWSIYLLAGGGLGFSGNDSASLANYGRVGITLVGGLGTSYRICDHSFINLEYTIDINGDAPNPKDLFKWHHTNGIVRLGYFYCFGVTAADAAIVAQKAMLTQDNFAALNNQVNNLENQVNESRNNEKKLENRIAELEDQLNEAMAANTKNDASDSLQAVIDKIKADQMNYYAMPFSVQYGVDQWRVSDEEMAKVQAVGRVLKDNSDVKITVIGFADHTGSDNYNMKLSEKRANEVKRLLVKKYGIDEDRIKVESKGKGMPFGDAKYSINRRVSFYREIE
ncbi:MAG: OmpA family protein [Bacteroidales bacterium]|nr:OmpA family protein [Bacteroidales bacterium]MBR1799463.1 OmpA family protein [Bacteroidales bacterium]